jgi:hypothetical protein
MGKGNGLFREIGDVSMLNMRNIGRFEESDIHSCWS